MDTSKKTKKSDIAHIQDGKVAEVKEGHVDEVNTWQIPEQEIKRGMAGDEIEEMMIEESGVNTSKRSK